VRVFYVYALFINCTLIPKRKLRSRFRWK